MLVPGAIFGFSFPPRFLLHFVLSRSHNNKPTELRVVAVKDNTINTTAAVSSKQQAAGGTAWYVSRTRSRTATPNSSNRLPTTTRGLASAWLLAPSCCCVLLAWSCGSIPFHRSKKYLTDIIKFIYQVLFGNSEGVCVCVCFFFFLHHQHAVEPLLLLVLLVLVLVLLVVLLLLLLLLLLVLRRSGCRDVYVMMDANNSSPTPLSSQF